MSGDQEMVPEEYGSAEPGWSPRGEHDVEMALRGLERLAAKFTAIQQQGVAYRADIDAWEQGEVHRLRADATNLYLGLQAYARERRLLSKGKDKTFRFPSGVLTTRSGTGRVEVLDEAACIAWSKMEAPDAVKVAESLLTSKLMKTEGVAAQPDGKIVKYSRRLGENNEEIVDVEVVPGVKYLAGGESRITADVELASQRKLPAITSGE